ncbi:hypothetical protein B4U79_12932, partial [Dinothrombium tinctorium]
IFNYHNEADKNSEWSYEDQDNWGRINKNCSGSNQSPINIGYNVKPNPGLRLNIPAAPTSNVIVENTGYTAQISFANDQLWQITGSAVNHETFTFSQLHFHWSENYRTGSEHALYGRKFSGEAHFVFYNQKYGTFEKASSQPDGLTVLGVFLKLSYYDNQRLNGMITVLGNIEEAKSKIESYFDVTTVLPFNRKRFFRYSGSLTTPPCSENVNWIVFATPIRISSH